MTDDELDTARMYEAQRRHGGGLMTAESMAKCAARLAREGWTPTDPDLVLAREVVVSVWKTQAVRSQQTDDCLAGIWDDNVPVQIALAAIRAARGEKG